MKKIKTRKFVKKLRSDETEKMNKSLGLKIEKVSLSLSDISFILNIFGKKWIPIKFDIRVTKYVFI
jgi:hypothetical protein